MEGGSPVPYDAVELAREVAELVSEGDRRKYYRLRPARFYGGIATADCVGCCLECVFCWSWRQVEEPHAHGRLLSPEQVAGKLRAIAGRHGFSRIRISGNEPTLAREHLLEVLRRIPKRILFVLETNGILIGHDPGYAPALAEFENLHVRLSLKGATEEEFSRLTGARPEGFRLQVRALEHLHRAGVRAHPAVMAGFSPRGHVDELRRTLAAVAPGYADLEVEELMLYGEVQRRLRRAGLEPRSAPEPE